MSHVQIFLDWDGTLTKKDTIQALASIGYAYHERMGEEIKPWNHFVDAYMSDFDRHTASYMPAKQDRRTAKEVSAHLKSLAPIEMASVERVGRGGVFRGLRRKDLIEGAEGLMERGEVELRKGWKGLWQLGEKTVGEKNEKVELTMVSVNWSGVFIRACLEYAAKERGIQKAAIDRLMIWSNEIEGMHDSAGKRSTGSLTSEILVHTSADKCELVEGLAEGGQMMAEEKGQSYISVYVGDSMTDFDALLLVDIGICVRDEPMSSGQRELAETLEGVGIEVKPLAEAKNSAGTPKTSSANSKAVYWTADLEEIYKLVSSGLLGSP